MTTKNIDNLTNGYDALQRAMVYCYDKATATKGTSDWYDWNAAYAIMRSEAMSITFQIRLATNAPIVSWSC